MIRESLLKIFTVCGCESAMAHYIESEIGWCFDEVKKDSLGNLIFHKAGSGKRLIFACHMDKCGLVVTFADKDKVKVSPLGKLDVYSACYARVKSEEGYTGILIPPAEITSETKLSDFTADFFGCNESLNVGDRLEFVTENENVNNNVACGFGVGTLSVLQSLMDAAGAVRASDNDIYFVFSSMGEENGRNISQAVYGIDADFAVFAQSCDDEKSDNACLLRMAKNFTPTPSAVDFARSKFEGKGLNYSLSTMPKALSEAAFLQNSGKGTPTVALCVPVKRRGSAGETVTAQAINSLTEALTALI